MATWQIVLIVIALILIGVIVALYFLGKKAQKRKDEQDAQIAAAAQTLSMLIIDKKRMPVKDAGLPGIVMEQMPKMMRRTKLPIVKAKVGPKIMTFICDAAIFDSIPTKKEVKAVVSGLYITSVKGIRASAVSATPKKKGIFARARLAAQQHEAKKKAR